MSAATLLPRARLWDVLRGRAPLVGARLDPHAARGLVSPVEARLRLGLCYEDLAADESTLLANAGAGARLSMLLRAALAQLAAPPADAQAERRPFVVSTRVDAITIADTLEKVVAEPDPAARRARFLHFVHPHALNLAVRHPGLREALHGCDAVLPDGIGLRLAARWLGKTLPHNVNGTDLWPLLVRALAAGGLPLVLIGGKSEVVREAARRMREHAPGLRTPLVSDGYLDADASRALASRIAELGRCVVLVGMGSPRQETWAWEHLAACRGATVLTVGGLFDFVSGSVARAPRAWRELGMEWLWRGLQEPRRLGARYLVGNPLFLARVAQQRALG